MLNSETCTLFYQFNCNVDVYDSIADRDEVKKILKINILPKEKLKKNYDCILKLVSHQEFANFNYMKYRRKKSLIFDIKGTWDKDEVISL